MDGLHAVTPEMLIAAFKDAHPAVREHALRISEALMTPSTHALNQAVFQRAEDPEIRVRYQLAFTLAGLNDSTVATAGSILATLAFKDFDDAHMMTAIKVSASRHLYSTLDAVLGRLKKPEAATQNGAKHEPPTPPARKPRPPSVR